MHAWRQSTLSAAAILLRAETVCITSWSSFTVIYGKTRSVWIKEMMPRQEKGGEGMTHFPNHERRAKGQTNQWQFGRYPAVSIDWPPGVKH